jgi:hypothetical protein
MTKERMYDWVTIIIVLILLILSIYSYGQSVVSRTKIVDLKSFVVKQIGDKNYIIWTALSTDSDFYFVLEKSTNDSKFETVSTIKGFSSPLGKPLLYSFVDEKKDSCLSPVYRLKAYKINYEIIDGEKIQVYNRFEPNLLEDSNFTLIDLNKENEVLFSLK